MQFAKEVNDAIADLGRKSQVGAEGLDFFCECSTQDCLERLALTLPLLVQGHLFERAADARAHAQNLVDSASALRAQSAQQKARVRRNLFRKLDDR